MTSAPAGVTLIDVDGQAHQVTGTVAAVSPQDLERATGWVLKPEGLCRGEVCTPLFGVEIRDAVGNIKLPECAAALGLLIATDDQYAVVAVVPARPEELMVGSVAPDLELPDVAGHPRSLSELSGRKRVLVTWASWCGCRHELASWRELQDELGPAGLSIYSVALDNSVDDAKPWIDAGQPSYPVVVDSAHVTAQKFGITNVPSTVWIDEEGRIVKPATIAPGDDQFKEFTQIDSSRHHDALRKWVTTGEVPTEPSPPTQRSNDEQLALAERRIGAYLHGAGQLEAAQAHLARAVELAPWDWTVRRASIALRGEDPFLGEEFVDFWQQWDAAGRPGYAGMT